MTDDRSLADQDATPDVEPARTWQIRNGFGWYGDGWWREDPEENQEATDAET